MSQHCKIYGSAVLKTSPSSETTVERERPILAYYQIIDGKPWGGGVADRQLDGTTGCSTGPNCERSCHRDLRGRGDRWLRNLRNTTVIDRGIYGIIGNTVCPKS